MNYNFNENMAEKDLKYVKKSKRTLEKSKILL